MRRFAVVAAMCLGLVFAHVRPDRLRDGFGEFAAAADAEGRAFDEVPRVEEFVRAEMARQKLPGVGIAIVRKGQPLLVKGYGEANVEHHVPVTADTIFQSGSVGKQFTAAAVMLLVEDGVLALSDPLTTFFPDAPAHWKGITIRHLLTHTSGLPDYTGGSIDYRKDHTEEDLLRMAYGLKPEFPPGARWNYSNTGYVLLGIAIRKASGRFYGDILRDRVFAPLGMKTARIISEADIVPNRAAGYRLVNGELRNQEWVAPQLNTTADGSLYFSLRDLVAWDAALRDRRLLKPPSWQQILTPVSLNSGKPYPYGFGWNVEAVNGHRVEMHGGSWQGFQTYIARFPDDELTIVALTNLAQANPQTIVEGIAAILDPTLKRPELNPIPDTYPAVQTRVRRLLDDARAGKLSAAEFAYVRAGFFPGAAKRYADSLAQSGPLQSLTLLEARELGDDRLYTFDATFAKGSLRVRVAVAPDDKIAEFSLRPVPR